ncbi:MAG TPA: hypothetical protein VMM55_11025 [Thermohalobaculum sp.]|nr:hypothetical protein [Thermohalobaculum sp.]
MQDVYDFWAQRISGDRLGQIEAMWTRFAENARQIDEARRAGATSAGALSQIMASVLGPLGAELEWSFAAGPAGAGTQTLVLSAGARHDRRVLARAVLDNAPDLRGWAFAETRPPVGDAVGAPEEISARDNGRRLSLLGIEAEPGQHRRIDLIPRGNGDAAEQARQAALAFEVLLGEDKARDWLGLHEPRKKGLLGRLAGGRGGGSGGRWCEPLRDTCWRLIAQMRENVPPRPFAEQPYDRNAYVMYQAMRLEQDPAWRNDTITGYTSYRAMAHARMAGDPMAAERFSRFGEAFCGLKVARTPDFPFGETEQRTALAEGAHLMLSTHEQGGVTGEAVGHAHVYVDLALTDVSGGLETLAELLDRIELNGPAWLIFDEAGLKEYAVPLTPRTPAVPRPSYK